MSVQAKAGRRGRPLSFQVASGCLLLALLLGDGCTEPVPRAASRLEKFSFKRPYMGTLFTITVYALDPGTARAGAEAAFGRIAQLEDIMSDYQADSELNLLREQPVGKAVPVSKDLYDVLEKGQEIAQASGGAFDVTIGPLVRQWRFARKRKVMPSPAEMAEVRGAAGFEKLRVDRKTQTVMLLVPNMRLDLGGIAKGYAADQALALLKSRGLPRALVAASGDIAVGDAPPGQPGWRIGISAMGSTNRLAATVCLRNAGISTSGGSEQFIEIAGTRHSHILDPATGLGLTNRIQASVVGPNAATTDALATAVCVLGSERGLKCVEAVPGTAAFVVAGQGGNAQPAMSPRFKRLRVE
jgi:thiamine biosynthesis lipoprotein